MIKEINNYLEPVNKSFAGSEFSAEGSIGGELLHANEVENATCALIGISETRNAIEGQYECNPDFIRKSLYKLSNNDLPKGIVDLGNILPGKTIADTYEAINYVVDVITKHNIIPVFFGGTTEISHPICSVVCQNNNFANISIIDSYFDIGENNDELHSHSYIKKVLNDFDNIDISILGYQSYFACKGDFDFLDENNIEYIRLGNIRSNFNGIEPILRDSDFCSIDINSVRYPDCSSNNHSGPNGFYSDEICRIAFLSGLSDRISIFHLGEYNSIKDENMQGSMLYSQIIWHFLNGINQRKNDYPTRNIETYNKIYVKIDKPDIEILFYKNEQNHRYWIEIPETSKTSKKIVSCSESDYKSVCNGNFPNRIWKKMQF